MSEQVATRPRSTDGVAADDHLDHWVCLGCDENTSLCGKDVTDDPWIEDMTNECVVCRHTTACPQCGDEFIPVEESKWANEEGKR